MTAAAFLLALIVLVIAPWAQVPAPVYGLLPLSVGAPELSAWLLVMGLAAVLLSLLASRRGPGRRTLPRLALALSLAASAFPMYVLAQIPSGLERMDAEWQRAFGTRAATVSPMGGGAALRPHPFTWREMFVGLDLPPVRIHSRRGRTHSGRRPAHG